MNTHAVVERASQMIQRDEIHDALVNALRSRGAGNDFEVELAASTNNLHVAADVASTVGIEGLSFDAGTGRFVATVAVPANDPAAARTRVTGRIHKLVSLPVLAETKRRGDVIRANDIQWREVRASEVRDHVITDEEELVGMAAKRERRSCHRRIGAGRHVALHSRQSTGRRQPGRRHQSDEHSQQQDHRSHSQRQQSGRDP